MGQQEATPSRRQNAYQEEMTASGSLVEVDRVAKKRGSIPIAGRYTTQKRLEEEYTMEMKSEKPLVIGTGLNGPVQLATGRDGRKYAIKSFKKHGLNSKRRAELKGEVEIFLSLDHPHIARLEQVYETEDCIHLVMEFMAGGELYDRLARKKRYSEDAAANVFRQMLLAVAYLHVHQVCHRDLKLENFLYESPDTEHLKLIDFGFARFRTDRTKMSKACGSVHYVAPEVLFHSYTELADMWSLGVISHMVLTGSPVFHGSDSEVVSSVKSGRLRFSSKFVQLSAEAQDFVKSLLKFNPSDRLTAQQALEHSFVSNRNSQEVSIDMETLKSLQKFGQATHFRRACFSMMAWSLSREDRMELRDKFLELDAGNTGTISLQDFKNVFEENFDIASEEAEKLFANLDADHDNEICYSDFLAAAVHGRVKVHEDLLRKTFERFDVDQTGEITVDNLRTLLGDTDADLEQLIQEADADHNGRIDYEEFLDYLQNPALDTPAIEEEDGQCSPSAKTPASERRDKHCEIAVIVIDSLVAKSEDSDELLSRTAGTPLSRKAAGLRRERSSPGARLKIAMGEAVTEETTDR